MSDVFTNSAAPDEPFPPALGHVVDRVDFFEAKALLYDDTSFPQKYPELDRMDSIKILEHERLPDDYICIPNTSIPRSTSNSDKHLCKGIVENLNEARYATQQFMPDDISQSQPSRKTDHIRNFQRNCDSRKSDSEVVDERRKFKMDNSNKIFYRGNVRNDTRKRHSSGGAVLADRRYIEFGPVWLNGNGSVTDLTPTATVKGDNISKPVQFHSCCDLSETISKTTTSIGTLPSKSLQKEKSRHFQRFPARAIGQIGNLDELIQLRRKVFHKRSRSSPETETSKLSSCENISDLPNNFQRKTETFSTLADYGRHQSLPEQELHTSAPNITGSITPGILSKSASVADMKSALKRVRSKRVTADSYRANGPVRPSTLSVEKDDKSFHDDLRNSTYSLQPVDELRRNSGSVSRLRRARSFFMKQKAVDGEKMQDLDTLSRTGSVYKKRYGKQKSLNEHQLYKNATGRYDHEERYQFGEDSLHGITDAEVTSLSSSNASFNILMQGDLYRRRRLAWTKTWAVLTTDRLLTLYKSRKEFEEAKQEEWRTRSFKVKRRQTFSGSTSLSGIFSIINLSGGCEIENVEQGKKGTAFQLMPHSYHTFTFRGESSTLPPDAEWRRTHKPVHLLCKNNDEFLYWVKALVELNSAGKFSRRGSRRALLITPSDSTLSLQSQGNVRNQSYTTTPNQFWNDSYTSAPNRTVDWPTSTPATRRNVTVCGDKLMSVDSEYAAAISGVNGRRSSKGLNLDEIKFIDDEDNRETVRTVKNVGRNSNPSSNRTYAPSQATILEGISTNNSSRPLSSERLESKRREIERLRMKVAANAEKGEKTTINPAERSHRSRYHAKTDNAYQDSDAPTKQVYSSNPRDESSSHKTDDYPKQNQGPANKPSREPFERGGFMRDKVREKRKKKTITNRSKVRNEAVASKAVGEGEASSSSYGSESSDASNSDSEEDNNRGDITKLEAGNLSEKSATTEPNRASLGNPPSAKFNTGNVAEFSSNHQSDNHFLSRLEKQSSIKHLHHRFVGRKQKSLRQKVLRKLGQQAILSNSSPDINAAVEDEDNESESSQTNPEIEVKLKRHQAFRTDRRPSSPAVLTRCQSEDILLYDSSSSEDDTLSAGRMRTLQLSEETFLETYGVIPRRKKKGKDSRPFKRHTTYNLKSPFLDFSLHGNESDNATENNRRRRLSASESGSSGSSVDEASQSSVEHADKAGSIQKQPLGKSKSDGAKEAVVLRRPRSTGSDDGASTHTSKNKEARNSWIASLTPNFGKKSNKDSPTRDAPKITRKVVFNTPASRLTNASHKGYLDWRNKKKQWERLWCVLQDSCLYMYNSPQSSSTEDAVVLRGYNVVANVKNLNRTRFPFRLERNGSPTIHLSADSDRDYFLWVGTLEKETSMVLPGSTDNEVLITSIKNTMKHTSSETPTRAKDQDMKPKSFDKDSTGEEFQLQKEHLLREVFEKTQKVVEEQRLLQERHSNSPLPITVSPPTTKISKSQLNEKFKRAREEEEMRSTKQLTLLNRRRNSAQIKVDQMAKQLAPKSGRKRRENPQQFADMEAKLREMQDKLDEVDKEISERQTLRQDTMEKIKQRLELELLILEQRDTIDIIRKHGAWQGRPSSSPQNPHRDRLPSIDEVAASECSSTSSISMQNSLSPEPRNTTPSPCTSHDTISSTFTSSEDNLSNVTNSNRDIGNIETLSDELDSSKKGCHGMKTKHTQHTRPKNEVDPSILADIEDFQRFSRQKLASLANHR